MKILRRILRKAFQRAGYQLLKPGDLEQLIAARLQATRGREGFLTSHPPVKGPPKAELSRAPAVETPERVGTARRLMQAYRLSSAQEQQVHTLRGKDDLWTGLVVRELGELLQLLASDDAHGVAQFLSHFGEQYTWFGGLTFALDGYTGANDESRAAFVYLEKLICLAEAVGVLPVEHPEHGHWGENLYADVGRVISSIERELGISISPPEGAVFVAGLSTPRGAFHYRHLNAVYTAFLLSGLVSGSSAIAEYGGGLGTVGLYARRMGFLNYTIFDIPISNLFAGHFLINAIGPEAVTLYGEEQSANTLKVLPYWTCMDAAPDTFELSLNQDSFPEIDVSLVRRFFAAIRTSTRSLFLSINHEAQSEMTATERQLNISAMLKNETGFHRLYRKRYWLREGYAEETYRIAKPGN